MPRARVIDLRDKVKRGQPWQVRWDERRADGTRAFHKQRFPTKVAATAFVDDLNAKLSRDHTPGPLHELVTVG